MKNFPEGHPRPYIRDGVSGLPREEQRKILVKAGVPMDQLFEDKLSAAAVRRRNPAELKLRAEMVAPTTRTTGNEVIYVAEGRVLGLTMPDIVDTIAKAIRRRVTYLVEVRSREVHKLVGDDAAVLDMLAKIEGSRNRAVYEKTLAENRAAIKRKRDRAWDKIKTEIEVMWYAAPDDPNWMKGEDIAFKVGKSLRTLHNKLGPRGNRNER